MKKDTYYMHGAWKMFERIVTILGWILVILGLFFFQLPNDGHF